MTVRRLARRLLPWFALGVIVLLGIQLVPYGWGHRNPPVTERAPWPSEEARLIAGESVVDGQMPPLRYVLANPEARLSPEKSEVLIDALRAMQR